MTRSSGLSYDEMVHLLQAEMKKAAVRIGKATFRLEIDETAPSHMISHHAINDVIFRKLPGGRARVTEQLPRNLTGQRGYGLIP